MRFAGSFAFVLLGAVTMSAEPTSQTPDGVAIRRFAAQMEENLRKHILAPWFPRAVDKELGGFRQGFAEDWTPTGSGRERSIVYQSRLTWVASQVSERYPNLAEEYRGYVRHGIAGLEKQWDRENGGFFWQRDAGTGQAERNGEKHAYGISFGIYASAAAYEATKDPRALDLAKRTFEWLEKHAHDGKNGGYYEGLTREGKPIMAPDGGGPSDFIGTHYGYKSMNTHIHLLEAFTELYHVWRDASVRKRLEEVFHVVRDKVYVDPGCLNLFFNPDWRPVPDHDSFGHDIETAYLLAESAAALGKPNDADTWRAARNLVDHALDYGWDEKNGGFYDAGPTFGPATHRQKVWWTQAEGLNALLLMHERYGKEAPRYWQAFLKQWEFIRDKQTDAVNTGWFSEVTPDGERIPGREKSSAWTDPYHQGRALMNVIRTLGRLAENPGR